MPFSSIKFFNEIKLNDSKIFYAHTSKHSSPEQLKDHFQRTLAASKQICQDQDLNTIIRGMLHKIFGEDRDASIFEELLKNIIYYHDIGKINPKFQKKLENHVNVQIPRLDSNHSLYGQKIFEYFYIDEFREKLKNQSSDDKQFLRFGRAFFFIFTSIIGRHHSYIKNIMIEDDSTMEQIHHLGSFALNWDEVSKEPFTTKYKKKLERDIDEIKQEGLHIFYLYKLAYSLTTLSDYYATLKYTEEKDIQNKVIREDFIKKIKENFYVSQCFNKKLIDENYVRQLSEKEASELIDVGEMRTRMLLEADKGLNERLDKGEKIFYLEMPTGGGKTNASLKLILSILSKNPSLKRVFYVFPFINLIKQNYDFIKKTMGMNDNEISPIYSMSEWDLETNEESEEIEYVLNQEFMNYPFVVISNVNFFNTFIKNKKNDNIRLVNFANSIVVLDEIQSLNDKEWKLFSEFIKYSSESLNIYYVIMSATLPDILSLSDNKDRTLIKKDTTRIFFNKFYERTDIVKRFDIDSAQKLRLELLKEIKCSEYKKILIVLNTVRDSKEVFWELKKEEELSDFDICLLNSTVLNVHRAEKIEKFDKGERVILVSTQCVEAGLDLDADFGIRDACILDSIEQVSGRVNRNFNKSNAKVFVSWFKNSNKTSFEKIYGRTERYEASKKLLSKEGDYERSCIGDYYGDIIENLKKTSDFQESADSYIEHCSKLEFEKLNSLDIIQSQSRSFILDVEIDISKFSKPEIDFLESVGLDRENGRFSGREVFDKFQQFKKLKSSFAQGKILNKKWSSILSKFSISLQQRQINDNVRIIECECYSEDTGLNLEKIKNISAIEDRII